MEERPVRRVDPVARFFDGPRRPTLDAPRFKSQQDRTICTAFAAGHDRYAGHFMRPHISGTPRRSVLSWSRRSSFHLPSGNDLAHWLEKSCRKEPVRASKLAEMLKVLQQWESEQEK